MPLSKDTGKWIHRAEWILFRSGRSEVKAEGQAIVHLVIALLVSSEIIVISVED